jgi:hypothetical protein
METVWLPLVIAQKTAIRIFTKTETFAFLIGIPKFRRAQLSITTRKMYGRVDAQLHSLKKALSPAHKKSHNRTLLSGSTPLKHGRHFDYWPASDQAHARLLSRLSWSLTVLLPSDTHTRTNPIPSHLWLVYRLCLVLSTKQHSVILRLQAGRPRNRSSNPGMGKISPSCPLRPDRLWPTQPPTKWVRGGEYFPGGKGAEA